MTPDAIEEPAASGQGPLSRIDPHTEELRARLAVAFTLLTSLEVQARLAGKVDDELALLLGSAHGQACAALKRVQRELRDYRRSCVR